MSTYVFVYRVPRGHIPGDPADGDAFVAWFRGISDHVIKLGEPVFSRRVVGASPSQTDLGGYSLISAESLDEAVRLTAGCPALARGGSVEVGELTELPAEVTEGIGLAAHSAA